MKESNNFKLIFSIIFLLFFLLFAFLGQKRLTVYNLCPTQQNVSKKGLLNAILFTDGTTETWLSLSECSDCLRLNTSEIGVNKFMVPENFVDVQCDDTKRRFLKNNKKYKHTALASKPGSGNTWVRHLIEEITGIYTGSVYNSTWPLRKVFIGENTTEGVVVIKTHEGWKKSDEYERAVVIVRDPFESILSEDNRLCTGSQTRIIFKENFNKTAFIHNLGPHLKEWQSFYRNWLVTFPGPVFALFYEKLKSDLRNSLAKLARFLGTEITLQKLWCVGLRREGSFHRPPKPDWMSRSNLVTSDLEIRIQSARQGIVDICKNSINQNRITTNL